MIKPVPAGRPLALLVALLALVLSGCGGAAAPPAAQQPAASPSPAAAPAGSLLARPAYAAELAQPAEPTPTRRPLVGVRTAEPAATAAPEPPAAPDAPAAAPGKATTIPTPSPRAAGTPPRVGLQVGHWKSNELPEELARLRNNTGASYGGVSEAELNLDIASRIKPLLEAQGVVVDLIPATVPPSYDADVFVAIHADGSSRSSARGWKMATPWRASRAAQALMENVAAAYGPASGLPHDAGGVTVNMKGYYAFNYRRHVHAIARTTPGIIVELGFMTNAADRAVLFGQPDRVAGGIAQGILAYLGQRDPNDGAALLPPEYPSLRVGPGGATMRAEPRENAGVVARLRADSRVFAIDRVEGWYRVYARDVPNTPGWIREDQLVVAPPTAPGTPPAEPTSTNP